MTLNNQQSSLSLHGLEFNAFLGWPEEERQQQQPVKLDLTVHFPEPSLACISDSLDDTFSYDILIARIQEKIAAKSFRLLEHLGYEIYLTIKQLVPANAKVSVSIKKNPAIPLLTGGASFYFGD